MAAGSKLRPLGPLEKYSAVRSHLGVYLNVCVTATFEREINDSVKPALFRALSAVIAKHPILSVYPSNAETSPQFVGLHQIDLNKTVTFVHVEIADSLIHNNRLLDEILTAQHNSPFKHQDPPAPFWRLLVLEHLSSPSTFSLCFCFHHALIDTQSAMIFLEDLEDALCNHTEGKADNIVDACSDTISPPLESLLTLETSAAYVQSQQISTIAPEESWSGAPQTLPTITRISSLSFSAASALKLRQRCKAEGASLTAGLMSLIASAFFRILPEEYTVLQGDCAVSLRRFVPKPDIDRCLGCYVGSFSESYSKTHASIWEDARRTRTSIDVVVQQKGEDMLVGYLRHIPDMSKWFMDKMGKKRQAAWELSNVGAICALEPRSSNSYRITDVVFSQSAGATSGAVKISVATGRSGNLAMSFSWQQGVVENEVVTELMANIAILVTEITSEET